MSSPESDVEVCIPINASEQIEFCYERGWTDGLPVVPATSDLVGAMLEAGRLAADDIIAEMPSRNVSISAQKVAINAVMAGCRPEYMPVVTTAVKCLADPSFGLHHVAAALAGPMIVVVVNGPIAARLGINATDNVFGQGHRANATIGRAVRLVMMNCMNYRPGLSDRATFGMPGKYTCCIAENEVGNPWGALHLERGFSLEQSTVTLIAASSMMQVWNYGSPEGLLTAVGDALAYLGSIAILGRTPGTVVFAGEHTQVLHENGWTKARIRGFVVEHTRRKVADLKRAGRIDGPITPEDEETWHYAMDEPDELIILCAGSKTGALSVVLPGFGSSKTAGRSRTYPIAF